MRTLEQLQPICQQFAIDGELIEIAPHGRGYINDTYLGRYRTSSGEARYIHQRINHQVFKKPVEVMENIQRVTEFARQQIEARGGDPRRETLNVVPARDGGPLVHWNGDDPSAEEYWRTYLFIDGTHTYEGTTQASAEDLEQVYHGARAFGNFQKLLAELPGGRLHETIVDFHHTRKRFETFQRILAADPANRAGAVRAEIDFLLHREADASRVVDLLASGALPERGTHNDTKLNNVLIDNQTGQGICVVDLDTVMPGATMYDFGDLIRMGTATAGEDERDLASVGSDLVLFEQLARGYLEAARDFLTPQEWDLLVFSGRLITYEQAIRYLGDYLNGDVYYKVSHPSHNLERARTQIRMLEVMEAQQKDMEAIIHKLR